MSIVIIGAGQAGVQAADSLRDEGYRGTITVVGDETVHPYQRPPLSKDFLQDHGDQAEASVLPLRPEEFYQDKNITLLSGVRAESLDRERRTVQLSDGSFLEYENLILATGASNREIKVPGMEKFQVHTLRTLDDAHRLGAAVSSDQPVLVIGAGFIGLECAASLNERGCDVTVLEAAPRPMGRALSPTMSAWFTQAHAQLGIKLQLDEGIAGFDPGADGASVIAHSTTEAQYPADLVIVGVGVQPRDELAAAAGLAVDNGIIVDEQLRTVDEHIFAIGDCTRFPEHRSGQLVRLESVQNASAQARHVAAVIMGAERPYQDVPWFWSVQGPFKLQIAGLVNPGDDSVILGDTANGKFSVLLFRNNELVAVESVNRAADHMAARKLLSDGVRVTREQAESTGFTLRQAREQAAQVTG